MNKEIQKAFEYMINQKPIVFSEKGLSEIKKIYGLKVEKWTIISFTYDLEIEIESESHFQFSGLGMDWFNFE